MASGGPGDNPLLDKRLGPFIALVLKEEDFTSIRDLKTALKEMVKEELVEEHTDYICDAWMAHNKKDGECKEQRLADRLRNAPAADVAGPTPPATTGSPTQADESPELALDFTSDFIPFSAMQWKKESSYILQENAEELGLSPSDIGSSHVLKWYSRGADGQPQKMICSKFIVVGNDTMHQNVALGIDWNKNNKHTSTSERRADPTRSPHANFGAAETRTRQLVSQSVTSASLDSGFGKEDRLHNAIGARYRESIQESGARYRESIQESGARHRDFLQATLNVEGLQMLPPSSAAPATLVYQAPPAYIMPPPIPSDVRNT